MTMDADARTALGEAISEVLGEDIGEWGTHSFFDIGGDSLSAVRLATLMEDRGFDISLDLLFASESLDQVVAGAAALSFERQTGGGEGRTRPTTPAEDRALAAHPRAPDAWVVSELYLVDDAINLESLEQAMNALCSLHPLLSSDLDMTTRLWAVNSQGARAGQARFVECPRDNADRKRDAVEDAHRSLSLCEGRPLSVTLFHDVAGVWGVLPVINHIISDGYNWDLVIRDLDTLLANPRATMSSAPTGSMAEYRRSLSRAVQTEGETLVAEWAALLEGTALVLPTGLLSEEHRIVRDTPIPQVPALPALLACLAHAFHTSGVSHNEFAVDVSFANRYRFGAAYGQAVGLFTDTTPVVAPPPAALPDLLEQSANALDRSRSMRCTPWEIAMLAEDDNVAGAAEKIEGPSVYLNLRGLSADSGNHVILGEAVETRFARRFDRDENGDYPLRLAVDILPDREGWILRATWCAQPGLPLDALATTFESGVQHLGEQRILRARASRSYEN